MLVAATAAVPETVRCGARCQGSIRTLVNGHDINHAAMRAVGQEIE